MTTETAPARPAPVSSFNGKADPGPLWAGHTPNFPALLRQLGASLLVTTYQAGKLVMVRDEGDRLNTHYRTFPSPMGLALADGGTRLAIGTTLQVWEFHDVPSVARRLEPAGPAGRLPEACSVSPAGPATELCRSADLSPPRGRRGRQAGQVVFSFVGPLARGYNPNRAQMLTWRAIPGVIQTAWACRSTGPRLVAAARPR
jgi:hypothetical protein